MMKTMMPPQVGMILQTLQRKKKGERPERKKERPKKEKVQIKKREGQIKKNNYRDNATILLPHLCFKVAP